MQTAVVTICHALIIQWWYYSIYYTYDHKNKVNCQLEASHWLSCQ